MDRLSELFRQWAGEPCIEMLAIAGGGSSRSYYRIRGATKQCIGTVANEPRENEAFFAYTNHLRSKGIAVPELYAIADDRCHYLQQDLGDKTLYGLLYAKRQQGGGFDAEMVHLYRRVLADLDQIQKAGRDMDFSVGYPRAAFDRRAMLWDLNYFKYYFLKLAHIPFDEDLLETDFNRLIDLLLAADCEYFMYRDFQGRNIMLCGDESEPSLYYIDYQGGRRGAAQYDVASLLYSAKSDLPNPIRRELLQHYVNLHGDSNFMTYYWPYVVMRIMQTLGAYGYRGLYEKKPYFMQSIPLAVANLRAIIEDGHLPDGMPELQRALCAIAAQQPVSPIAASDQLTVDVMSFSYKQGLPTDPSGNGGGFIFDCRALPNPGRYDQYKPYTGKDRPVIEFLAAEQAVGQFLDNAQALVFQSIDKYLERHFTHLNVAFGCTGGQHRSVYCAEQMGKRIAQRYPQVVVKLTHREQGNI